MQRCVPVGRRCPSSSSAIIEKNEREKNNTSRRRFRRSSTVVRNNNDNINDGRRRNQINLKANERANERRKQAVIELSKREEACKGYCNLCGKTHTLERTREAEEVAKALLEKLRKQKSVSDEDESGQFLVEDVYDQQTGGKMIGVLLCETTTTTTSESERKVLKAFSGQWMGEWVVPGWCPPLARLTHDSLEYIEERKKIEKLSEEIKKLEKEASWSSSGSSGTAASAVTELKTKRKNMSRALLERIWDSYSLPSFRKERKMSESDDDDNSDNSNSNSSSSRSSSDIKNNRRKLVELNIRKCYYGDASKLPCGCGDCAAPKLLAECARKGWKPIAIAETWMGPNVKRGAGLREEGVFYGACLERCRPILGHMLCDAALELE